MGAATGSDWFGWFLWALPLIAGVAIAASRPAEAVAWVNQASAWWDRRHLAAKARGGLFVGFIWKWLTWGFSKLHRWTERIEDEARRAGLRVALFFYVAAISVTVMASLIYLALVVFVILIGIWLFSKFAGNRDVEMPRIPETLRRPAPEPEKAHGRIVDGPSEEQCRCSPNCPTSAVITRFSCSCVTVRLRNDELACDHCTDFTRQRWHCGAPGYAS